jgi:hypothetical protein
MHQYGTTGEQLAAVAVATPEWALLNRRHGEKAADDRRGAVGAHGELSLHRARLLSDHRWRRRGDHDHRRARPIAEKTARICPRLRPGDHSCRYSSMPDLTVTGARTSGRAAYATARLGPGDTVELYDAFTPSHSTRSFSARSRLLPERGAGPFVSDGHFEPGAVCRSTPMVVASLTPSRHVRIVPADRGGATATP